MSEDNDTALHHVSLIMDDLDFAVFQQEMRRRESGLASILPHGLGNREGRVVAECIRGFHDFLEYDPESNA